MSRDAAHGDGDGFLLANQHDKRFAAGDTRLEQITLKHGVVLRHDRDDDGRVFRALTLMNGRGVGRHQRVKLRSPSTRRRAPANPIRVRARKLTPRFAI
jgi:hypothetical protein